MDNIFHLAYKCLSESHLDEKLSLSTESAEIILDGHIEIKSTKEKVKLKNPGRPEKPILIAPKDLPRRNIQTIEGRAAMIHSFAHIEFNAINLVWDLICRFQNMPDEFYFDWARVAAEETNHFVLLRNNLDDIGYDYGDFPAHDGLWKIAEQTADDILLRLAVVPRILEARGLDVTPNLINRFRGIKDDKTVSILELILEEEIGHVECGSKWYRYICNKLNQDPDEKFMQIVEEYKPLIKTKNINYKARLMAGFSQSELDYLVSI